MARLVTLIIALLIPALLMAGDFPTICPNELTSWIQASKDLAIVDIQDRDGYREHNFDRSLATSNDPQLIQKTAAKLGKKRGKVIVVSATGGTEAVQAAELLVRGGVLRSRILLLEGGMQAAARNATCECCKPASLTGTSR